MENLKDNNEWFDGDDIYFKLKMNYRKYKNYRNFKIG